MMSLLLVIEALLFSSEQPLTAKSVVQLVNTPEVPNPMTVTVAEVEQALSTLMTTYQGRGITLRSLASGYQFEIDPQAGPWVQAMLQRKPPRYSKALLETLVVVAYRQPVTRGDIEAVRGVAVSSAIMKTLLDREWIRIVGYRDVPGKPAVYATTKQFLDYFGLKDLSELPELTTDSELDEVLSSANAREAVVAQEDHS